MSDAQKSSPQKLSAPRERAGKKGVSPLMAFFSSLKLTIFLLITLALVSIIGTVIPQNQLREEYLKFYSESTYETLRSVGFLDMYHSWWFVLIMALLTINLLACSWKNFPRTWKYFADPTRKLDPVLEKGAACVWRGSWPAEMIVESSLSALWGGTWHKEEINGEIHYSSEKGRWTRLGVYFVHLSVLVIFAGGIIGSLYGLKGYLNIPEGERSATFYTYGDNSKPISLGFEVECRDFDLELYESGRPKEYTSDLAIIEDGRVIKEKVIEVNHPISYKGFTFYQSSYGAYGGLVALELHFDSGLILPLQLEVGRPLRLPENWGWIEVLKYEENYMRMGPAALVLRDPGGGVKPYKFPVFLRYPEFGRENSKTGEFCVLKKVEQRYFTGLQVNKDPGVWVVWTGCLMMILGLYVAFFMSHKRLWLRLGPDPDKPGRRLLVLAGDANKNRPSFELEFETVSNKIKDLQK